MRALHLLALLVLHYLMWTGTELLTLTTMRTHLDAAPCPLRDHVHFGGPSNGIWFFYSFEPSKLYQKSFFWESEIRSLLESARLFLAGFLATKWDGIFVYILISSLIDFVCTLICRHKKSFDMEDIQISFMNMYFLDIQNSGVVFATNVHKVTLILFYWAFINSIFWKWFLFISAFDLIIKNITKKYKI